MSNEVKSEKNLPEEVKSPVVVFNYTAYPKNLRRTLKRLTQTQIQKFKTQTLVVSHTNSSAAFYTSQECFKRIRKEAPKLKFLDIIEQNSQHLSFTDQTAIQKSK